MISVALRLVLEAQEAHSSCMAALTPDAAVALARCQRGRY